MTDMVPISDVRRFVLSALAHVTLAEFIQRSGVSRTTIQNIVHQRAETTSKAIADDLKAAADELDAERKDKFSWLEEDDVQYFIRQCRAGNRAVLK